MRRFAFLVWLLSTLVPAAHPQDKPAVAPSTPTSGPRLEFLDEVSFYEQRFVRLAEAIPADKYSYRPAEGVRTVGEVYVHVATSNYNFAKSLGTPLPPGIDLKALAGSAGDKAKVLQALKDSFAYFRSAVLAVKDSELDNPEKTPRGQTTVRGLFLLICGHYGEHLGQAIANARQMGIVPPWTEERLRQEAEKPKP